MNIVVGILWPTVSLRLPFFGLKNDLTCLREDCCHESMVSHHGVARLSRPAEVSLEREAALPVRSQ